MKIIPVVRGVSIVLANVPSFIPQPPFDWVLDTPAQAIPHEPEWHGDNFSVSDYTMPTSLGSGVEPFSVYRNW